MATMLSLLRTRQLAVLAQKRLASGGAVITDPQLKVGDREVVGFGYNGFPNYRDTTDFPMPAVRWRPNTLPDVKELRQKEKGDWKTLSIAEKKSLYRASFCQTLAEVEAPSGEWKSVMGWTLFSSSLAIWLYMFFKLFAYNPELPPTFSEENQKAQLRRMIDLQMNPIEGLSSKYPRPT